MKRFRKATLIMAFALIATGAMAQSAKFGHVHSTYVMSKMPEYTKAVKKLTSLDSMYNSELEKLSVEINRKTEEFYQDTISPKVIRDTKAEEIQGLQIRFQQFQQRIEQWEIYGFLRLIFALFCFRALCIFFLNIFQNLYKFVNIRRWISV